MLAFESCSPSLDPLLLRPTPQPPFPWFLPHTPNREKKKKNPSKEELLSLRQTFPRQLLFFFFTSMSSTLMEILENHISADFKKVFDLKKKCLSQRLMKETHFFLFQNSLHMRMIQKSLKTVIPHTLIKRLVCFQIAEINSG